MTGIRLFARSRRWNTVIVISAMSAALIVLCGPLNYALNPRGGYLIAVAAQIPVLTAIAIQASLASPLPRQDALSYRSLNPYRLTHVVALTAVAAVAIAIAAVPLSAVDPGANTHQGALALIRNLLALTGAALIGAALLGPRLGWLLPVSWLILPFLVLPGPNADPTGLLTLAIQGDDAVLPNAFACLVWTIGTTVATINVSVPLRARNRS